MAKAKTKAGAKVPKRVGGAKIPKQVRKQAKKALKLVEAPMVREFAIAGLTAAAEALVQRTATELRAVGERQRKATLNALDLGDMLRAAAIEGARRFVEGFEDVRKTAGAAKPAARKPKAAAKPAAAKAPAKPARKAPAKRKPTARSGRAGGARAAAPE
jgi:hypothetical protein